MDTHNLTQLHEAAYGLKGISRNMGTEPLAQLASQIEAIGKAGEGPVLADWETQLQGTFEQTRTKLENVLNRAK